MHKAAVGLAVGQQILNQPVTIFYKAAVVQRNTQLTERDNDLRRRFRVDGAPRRKTAIAILRFGKEGQGFIRRGLDRRLALIFCQRLQDHCRHIRVGIACVVERPAPVLLLAVQNFINKQLSCRLCFCGGIFRNRIIPGI